MILGRWPMILYLIFCHRIQAIFNLMIIDIFFNENQPCVDSCYDLVVIILLLGGTFCTVRGDIFAPFPVRFVPASVPFTLLGGRGRQL